MAVGLTIYVGTLVGLHVLGRFPAPGARDVARLAGEPVTTLVGRVVDFPSTRWDQTRFVLEGQTPDGRFHGRTLVTLAFPEMGLAPGEALRVHGWLSLPRPVSERHAFDEEGYWGSQGVYSLLRVWSVSRLDRLCPSRWWNIRYQAWRFRQNFENFWSDRLPFDECALLLGITLGARGELAGTLKDACIRAGVYHIVVVSGQDVSLIVGLCILLLQAFKIPARRGLWMCAAPLAFYAVIVGANPPVVRATVMALIGLSTVALGRDSASYQPLLLAAGGILLISPEVLFGASFQLSFGATASLLVLRALIGDTRRFFTGRAGRRAARWVFDMACMGVAVNIGIGPVLVYYFQRFSLVGVFANWLVFPLAGAVMVSGLSLGMLGIARSAWVPSWSVWVLGRMLEALMRFITFLASGRWSAVALTPPTVPELLMYYGVLFGILWAILRRRNDAPLFSLPTRRHRL